MENTADKNAEAAQAILRELKTIKDWGPMEDMQSVLWTMFRDSITSDDVDSADIEVRCWIYNTLRSIIANIGGYDSLSVSAQPSTLSES